MSILRSHAFIAPSLPSLIRPAGNTCTRVYMGPRKPKRDKSKPKRASKRAASPPSQTSSKTDQPISFPGPLAPEMLENVNLQPADDTEFLPDADLPILDDEPLVKLPDLSDEKAPNSTRITAEVSDQVEATLSDTILPENSFPLSDTPRMKLPDLPTTSRAKKRSRRKKSKRQVGNPVSDADLTTQEISRLSAAYRNNTADRQLLIDELDKDPDYLLQSGNAKGEYDLASAIIGTGRPNEQGIYVLPYLQSGHLLLLVILLVIAYIYYPGFPLTEASDDVRTKIQVGLAIVAVLNVVLAGFAARAAKRRRQPVWIWVLKTLLLGDLAFGELRRNVQVVEEE